MLQFKNFSISFGNTTILNCCNLTLKKGEVTVITGTSGCGKSSFIRCMNGIIPQMSEANIQGTIIYQRGEESIPFHTMDITERSQYVSTVFQNPKTQFYATDTFDEMTFALENRCIPKEEILQRIDEYTSLLQTKHLLNRDIFSLSGGQKQMVAITSVAMLEQDIYIFDEPSSSLDQESIVRLADSIKKLKEMGKIIVIAEHRLYYLSNILDKLCVIEHGSLEEYTKEEITDEWIQQKNLRTMREIKKEELGEIQTIHLKDRQTQKDNAGLYFQDYIFSYGKLPILDCSFSFSKGINFIIGKNGVGKSTFFHCICGLNKKFKGKTYLDARQIKKPYQHISLVMQDVNYQIFTESVDSELSLVTRDETIKENILREMGLFEKRTYHPQILSGGEKQRLLIGIARASKKEIVLFDEPTSGLCKSNMMKMIHYIKQMEKEGKTILIITHDYELIYHCKGNVYEFC